MNIRKWAITPYVIIPLMLLVLSLSFSGFAASAPKTKAGKHFSGRELYAGITFGQGEVAAHLPYLQNFANMQLAKNDHALRKSEQFCNELMDEVQRCDPAYFNEYAAAVYSKDHYRIKQAIETGAVKMLQTGLNSAKYGRQFRESSGITREDLGRFDLNSVVGRKALEQFLAEKTAWGAGVRTKNIRDEKGMCVTMPCLAIHIAMVVYVVAVAVQVVVYTQEEQTRLTAVHEEGDSPSGTITVEQPVLTSLQQEKLVEQIAGL